MTGIVDEVIWLMRWVNSIVISTADRRGTKARSIDHCAANLLESTCEILLVRLQDFSWGNEKRFEQTSFLLTEISNSKLESARCI